jgi:uncharacterized membrane protein YhaH (DUF805 family)
MIDDESLNNIEKLHRLKADGIISDDEFEKAKERVLFGSRPAARKAETDSPVRPEGNGSIEWALLPLKRYADFTGRSSRKEFWSFHLAAVLACFAAVIIGVPGGPDVMAGLAILVLLGTALPSLAVQARRFHDQDKTGWFCLINLFPYVGWALVLIFMALEGTQGDNRYGPDPKER